MARTALGDKGLTVDVKESAEYDGMRLFLTEDKQSGFAITKDGDLESVFSNSKEHRFYDIMAEAVTNGAVRLDCYDVPNLVKTYQRFGFVPYLKVAYSEGFNKELDAVHKERGLNYVIAMYYNGDGIFPWKLGKGVRCKPSSKHSARRCQSQRASIREAEGTWTN